MGNSALPKTLPTRTTKKKKKNFLISPIFFLVKTIFENPVYSTDVDFEKDQPTLQSFKAIATSHQSGGRI